MTSVSAVVLTRDSQRTIESCVKSLKPAVDHVIVVDTGSTDGTVQIAKDAGARVYHFQWCDDFSAARNFGDSLATTDWVIHIDSDEIMRPEDAEKVRQVCKQFRKVNSPLPLVVGIQVINQMADSVDIECYPRLYKRGTLTWRGKIHEQLIARRGGVNSLKFDSDIGIIHDGYNTNVVDVQDKLRSRNIRLLRMALEQEPDNAVYHYFLGRDSMIIEDYDTAIENLRIAIDLFEQGPPVAVLESAHRELAYCLEQKN